MRSPDDSRRLYRDWSDSYDTEFARTQDYRLPDLVADAFHAAGGRGKVLDVGAGTGLCAQRLAHHGIGPIDGVDISPEMLAVAAQKRLYSSLFEADITKSHSITGGPYQGIVSAGTFTLGHVGPTAIDELIRVAAPGALFVLSVNVLHWRDADFAGYFASRLGVITPPDLPEVLIYGPAADESHRQDRACLATFSKR
ncbi:MAG: class I SAM-dependent methyltransferase [Paracoccaceae bacterium]